MFPRAGLCLQRSRAVGSAWAAAPHHPSKGLVSERGFASGLWAWASLC